MYNKCSVVDTALKNQLVSTFDNPYLYTPKNAYTVYATKMTLDIIQNIYTQYTCIYATEMSANDKRLQYPYNAEKSIEGIIERLNECSDLAAAASDQVSTTKLVHITYGLIEETGQYPEDFQEWRMHENAYCTSFQFHFIKAKSELRERKQTSRQGGYGSNNLVGIYKYFANLEQATEEDRTAETNLTGAYMILMTQVTEYANHKATKDSIMATTKNDPARVEL